MTKKIDEKTIKIVVKFIADSDAYIDRNTRIPKNLDAASELLYYAVRKKISKGVDVNDKVGWLHIQAFMGDVFTDYVESMAKIGKKWNLWGVTQAQLVEYIAEECDFITIKQRTKISHFPYDALDALWRDIMHAPKVISYEGDLPDTIRIAKIKNAHKAIIKSYLNSEFVTAVLKSGEERRGRIVVDPEHKSWEKVFIDFEFLWYVCDLLNLESWEPLYEDGECAFTAYEPIDGDGE